MSFGATPYSDRDLEALREIIRQEVAASLPYSGIYEYQVVASSNNTVDAIPADNTRGLPPVQGMPIRAGLPGATVQLAPGAHVAVGFLDQNPGKPYVFGIFDSMGAINITVTSLLLALGGSSAAPLAHASWLTAVVSALATFAAALSTAGTLGQVIDCGGTLTASLGLITPSPTVNTTAQ